MSEPKLTYECDGDNAVIISVPGTDIRVRCLVFRQETIDAIERANRHAYGDESMDTPVLVAELARLRAAATAMQAALTECADELEAEVRSEYEDIVSLAVQARAAAALLEGE